MAIERVIVKNYRRLRTADIKLQPDLNIIVGDNESGKSTLLEAINLALKGQINRRPALYELHPYLFNKDCVDQFINELRRGGKVEPPEILIELYLAENPDLASLRGTNNSLRENCLGTSLRIHLDDEHFKEEYNNYIRKPEDLRSIPIEYYTVTWQGFDNHPLDTRKAPVRAALIDPASISDAYGAKRYVAEVIEDYLSKKERVDLALSYRKMRDLFLEDEKVGRINKELGMRKRAVSDKALSFAMDMTAKAGWETGVVPHLDDIPLPLVGRGEQNAVKIKLAMQNADAADACKVFLIEEPENHLSHTNLNRLIEHLATMTQGKQLIVTTHSSFVLNKLGIEHVQLFNGEKSVSLNDLSGETKAYFKKLPGHDTLRMILAKRAILVEGPSDELVVTKAFVQKHGRTPLQEGVEVISVNALAFKRFLEVAKPLKLDICVVTDNDGNPENVRKRYSEYEGEKTSICYSRDSSLHTLEPQLLNSNGREKLNQVLCTQFQNDEDLLSYMKANKTDCALKIFDSPAAIAIPDYIQDAIR